MEGVHLVGAPASLFILGAGFTFLTFSGRRFSRVRGLQPKAGVRRQDVEIHGFGLLGRPKCRHLMHLSSTVLFQLTWQGENPNHYLRIEYDD